MSEPIDVYHKWLGIPPEDQPPDHYRLLAIKQFESDPDVIEAAADKQMAHLRTYQTGKQARLSQKLLNEVSAARVALLDPNKKAAYDQKLKSGLEHAEERHHPSIQQVIDGTTNNRVHVNKTAAWVLPAGISGVALLVLGILLVILAVSSKNDDTKESIADQTAEDKSPRQTEDTTSGGNANDTEGEAVGPDSLTVEGGRSQSNNSGNDEETNAAGEATNPFQTVDTSSEESPVADSSETVDPKETTASNFEPTTVAETRPVKRKPLPTDAQQTSVFNTLEETFQLSKQRTDEQQVKLAGELFDLAQEASDSTEKFVLLRATMNLAGKGGDAELVVQAVDEIDRIFDIERLDVEQSALLGFARAASTKVAFGSLVDATSDFVQRAITEQRFNLADELAGAVYEATVQKPAAIDFRKEAYDLRNRVGELFTKWKTVQEAIAELEANPDNPEANLTIGKWHCFEQNQWATGLPFLAKSGDERLSALAKQEINSSHDTTGEQLALADAWWDAAENASEDLEGDLRNRAGYWYKAAQPEVTSTVDKLRITNRLEEIEILPQAATPSKQLDFESGYYELIQSARRGESPQRRETFQFDSNGQILSQGKEVGTWKVVDNSLLISGFGNVEGPAKLNLKADGSLVGPVSGHGGVRSWELRPVKLLAVWQHFVEGDRRDDRPVYSNGRWYKADGPYTWSATGNKLMMRWPSRNAPGGAWVDTVTISADGKSYQGKNNSGKRVTGRLIRNPAQD